jgi:hypothetical protein
MHSRAGFIHGTGAAINVELGWIPDFVIVYNITDGTPVVFGNLAKVIAFTSGGTQEIKAGDTIRGLTGGASAKIREVILDSGSWAGGNAAGWFIVGAEDIQGTFGSENVEIVFNHTGDGVDHAAVVIETELGVTMATQAAATTADTGITSYKGNGDSNFRKGFTVGVTLSVNAKLLGYMAFRNGPGESQGPKVAGQPQSVVW